MYCEECRRLRAELMVRTFNLHGFVELPERFRKQGSRSAYNAGYEAGWMNRGYSNPYTRSDCQTAYYAGYRAGESESLAEIGMILDGRSARIARRAAFSNGDALPEC